MTFSPPQGRCTRWLLKAGTDVPDEVRNALIQSLYGTLPIYAGGVINTIAVALLIWWRNPQSAFQIWLALEIVCCLVRLCVLVADRRAAAKGAPTSTDLYIAECAMGGQRWLWPLHQRPERGLGRGHPCLLLLRRHGWRPRLPYFRSAATGGSEDTDQPGSLPGRTGYGWSATSSGRGVPVPLFPSTHDDFGLLDAPALCFTTA